MTAMLRAGAPDGDDHELQQDPVAAVASRPARALAQNCEQLDRLATDMAHCLEDARGCGARVTWSSTRPRRC